MLEKTTRVLSENLARSLDRRSFLRRTGQTAFASLAALAAGQALPMVASASGKRLPPQITPNCVPPGPYCNTGGGDLSGCHGASCFEHLYQGQVIVCRLQYGYQVECWTTADPPPGTGYWTCCDCDCYRNNIRVASCGCAQYSASPSPRPDRPVGPSPSRA
jgi:hypothetical protein